MVMMSAAAMMMMMSAAARVMMPSDGGTEPMTVLNWADENTESVGLLAVHALLPSAGLVLGG
jgi:hypothetical protein